MEYAKTIISLVRKVRILKTEVSLFTMEYIKVESISIKTRFLYFFVLFAGASAGSFFLYPSTKGKTENAIKELEFPGRTAVYRPGLLITDNFSREGESRLLERWGQSLFSKLDTSSKQSISVQMLAKSMVANALEKNKETKFEVLENTEIVQIAKSSTTE